VKHGEAVYSSDALGRRMARQVVGRRVDVSMLDGWNGRQPMTRIVAIGAPGSFQGSALQEAFEQPASDYAQS